MYNLNDEYIKLLYRNFRKRVKYADLPDKPNISVDTNFNGKYHFTNRDISSLSEAKNIKLFGLLVGDYVFRLPYSVLSDAFKLNMKMDSSERVLGGASRYVKIIHIDSNTFSISGSVMSDQSIRSYFIVTNNYGVGKVFASNVVGASTTDGNNFLLPYLVKSGDESFDIYVDMVDPRWTLSSHFKYQVSASNHNIIYVHPVTDSTLSSLPSGAIKATISSYIP